MNKITKIFLFTLLLVINLSFIAFSIVKDSYFYTALFVLLLIPVFLNIKYYFFSNKESLINTALPTVDKENLQLPTNPLKDSIIEIVKSSYENSSTLTTLHKFSFVEKKELSSLQSELQQLEELINGSLISKSNSLVLSSFTGEYKSDSSLAHYLMGTTALSNIICKNIIDNVSLIPHTGYDNIVDSNRLVEFLGEQRMNYEKVILYFNKTTLEKITSDFISLQQQNLENSKKTLINELAQKIKMHSNTEAKPHSPDQDINS